MSAALCPNCFKPIKTHKNNGCVLKALMVVLNGRGGKTRKELNKLHAKCNADALWDELGPIIDRLGDGEFSDTEEGAQK